MIKRVFKNAIFPGKCMACGTFLNSRGDPLGDRGSAAAIDGLAPDGPESHFHLWIAAFLCPDCLRGAVAVTPPFCTICGLPFKTRSGDNHVCGRCIQEEIQFRMARAGAIYQKGFMKLIHNFKYLGKTQLIRPLSLILLDTFMRFWRNVEIDLLIPVPLHPKRFRERGFNQAYLLVREWPDMADTLNLELPSLKIDRRLLLRKRHTTTQTGLGRTRRRQNIKDAFMVENRHRINDQRVLLVDDVMTTGATANECAGELLKCGARFVDILTLACAPAV